MARGASFDLDLEYRVGVAQGKEMRALKHDLSLSPTVNILRHPGWARAQETYGEDPVHVGEFGAAFTRGMQQHVPACPKHFAGNNTDNNRHSMIANMDQQTLRENYVRQFQIIVEKADPACIMAAYNGVNVQGASGQQNFWCTENGHLNNEILKGPEESHGWNWKGFVVSDWWATKDTGVTGGANSINGGTDLEMPDNAAFQGLTGHVQGGAVSQARIDDAVTRILNVRMKFGQLSTEYQNSAANPGIVNDQGHRDLARESAQKGAVLLKNDGILPLGPKADELGFGSPGVTRIMVMGRDANLPITNTNSVGVPHGLGDRGSSNTNPPYAVSYLKGIQDRAGSAITVTSSTNVNDATNADVVIIPVTMQHEDEGEAFGGGADRRDLVLGGFHPIHWNPKPASFINQVAAVNENVIVVLAVGSAIVVEEFRDNVKAIVQSFYPGQEGGNALASLLFGDLNFSAKLPFTVATSPAHYPIFGNGGNSAAYDYFHGYRKFEHENLAPRYWFGYGLSYTTYEYSDLRVLCTEGIAENGRLNVAVTVANTGKMAGDEIVQLYVKYPAMGVRRPPKELKAFARVSLAPGESKEVQLQVTARDLRYWGDSGWAIEKGEHTVLVGPSADPAVLLSAPFTIN
jgi:beta-glucosidase